MALSLYRSYHLLADCMLPLMRVVSSDFSSEPETTAILTDALLPPLGPPRASCSSRTSTGDAMVQTVSDWHDLAHEIQLPTRARVRMGMLSSRGWRSLGCAQGVCADRGEVARREALVQSTW